MLSSHIGWYVHLTKYTVSVSIPVRNFNANTNALLESDCIGKQWVMKIYQGNRLFLT